MASPLSPRRRVVVGAYGFGMALVLLATGLAEGQSAPRPGADAKADRAKAHKEKIERARANLSRRRAELGVKSSAEFDRARAEFRRKVDDMLQEGENRDRIRKEQALFYRFAPGQTFGYYLEIRTERPERVERFVGTPVFTVRSVDAKENKAELSAIGRLACYTTPRGTGEEAARPSRDVWIGTTIKLDLRARGIGGRDDHNNRALPDALRALAGPKRLIFTDLPASTPGLFEHSGGATLWFDPTAFNTVNTVEGRQTYSVRAETLSPALARIVRRQSFEATKGRTLRLSYESTSRFDRTRGLVLSTDGTCIRTEGDNQITTTVAIRLLGGDDLERAVARSEEDWKELPRALAPTEPAPGS